MTRVLERLTKLLQVMHYAHQISSLGIVFNLGVSKK